VFFLKRDLEMSSEQISSEFYYSDRISSQGFTIDFINTVLN
jgi:hypothetical protein